MFVTAKHYSLSPQNTRVFVRAFKLFVPFFILLVFVASVILYAIQHSESQTQHYLEKHFAATYRNELLDKLRDITSDLKLLLESRSLRAVWKNSATPSDKRLDELLQDFEIFALARQRYNQVRLLDTRGQEIARVNYQQGMAEKVPKQSLQNKKGRYYFDDALKLGQGQFFVSPLDLNVEHGAVERPLKPMIRFAAPVFDPAGNKRGVLLLNYFATFMLDVFNLHQEISSGSISMLLNEQGYWLKGARAEDEWGFMFDDRKDQTFGHRFPSVWNIIQNRRSGQLETAAGLFSFEAVHPLQFLQQLAGNSHAYNSSEKGYEWKVVSFLPHEKLYAARNDRLVFALWTIVLLSVVMFAVAWRVANPKIASKG